MSGIVDRVDKFTDLIVGILFFVLRRGPKLFLIFAIIYGVIIKLTGIREQ